MVESKPKDMKKKTQQKINKTSMCFDYENLLVYLRKIKDGQTSQEQKKKLNYEATDNKEARSQFRLFEKEYEKGKGMKDGGMGGLIVGNHYAIKQ